jgi:hypothetical protein
MTMEHSEPRLLDPLVNPRQQSIFGNSDGYPFSSLFYAPIDGEASAVDRAAWGTTAQ